MILFQQVNKYFSIILSKCNNVWQIDSENTTAVAEVQRMPNTELLVFDLKMKKQICVITTRDTRQEISEASNDFSVNLTPSVVTRNYILFICTKKQNPEQTANEGSVLFVFNFKSGKGVYILYYLFSGYSFKNYCGERK